MCKGVTNGLADEKFSTSPRIYGLAKHSATKLNPRITIPVRSFQEWKEWNGILSKLDFTPRGLVDPVWWRNKRWAIIRADRINGRRKWIAKNRVKVALPTANPPHTHWTMSCPRYGIADMRLVITVAPQNDIWPHGRTYPTNAVVMVRSIKVTPTVQVCFRKYEA